MKIFDDIEFIDLAIYTNKTLILTDFHIGYEEALNKQGVMVQCCRDGRHFRAFLNDPTWVEEARRLGGPIALMERASTGQQTR